MDDPKKRNLVLGLIGLFSVALCASGYLLMKYAGLGTISFCIFGVSSMVFSPILFFTSKYTTDPFMKRPYNSYGWGLVIIGIFLILFAFMGLLTGNI